MELWENIRLSKIISRYTAYISIIILISIGLRFHYFPTDVPLNLDALYYFWFASDIYQTGQLPSEWSPENNGWPLFLSFFFSIVDSKDIISLMQLQRIISVLISVGLTIPVYYLCKKFVSKKIAVFGASIIAFDPRLMINSFLGVADPLYLLLITTSLTLFLFSNKKIVYCSFILVSLATIVRAEGLIFFFILSIMFFIRYRKENKKIIFHYLFILGIFLLILLPISTYKMEINGNDGIFLRTISSSERIISDFSSNENSKFNIFNGLELFIKYLIWVLIPNFIIFIPLGLFLIFKKRDFKKNTIILSLGMMSIPAIYAYSVPALDTRYLYVLFPMFVILSALSLDRFCNKISRPNFLLIVIIIGIMVSSTIFYEQQKIDYEHEKESFEIMNNISSIVEGVNKLEHESSYLLSIKSIEHWPNEYTEFGLGNLKINSISTNNYKSLNDFIELSKNKNLSHIMIDNYESRPDFLLDVFENEKDYPYLKKIYDSKIDGYNYELKVFKIDYDLFNMKNQ